MIKFFKKLFLRIKLHFEFCFAMKEYRKLVRNQNILEKISKNRSDISYSDMIRSRFNLDK